MELRLKDIDVGAFAPTPELFSGGLRRRLQVKTHGQEGQLFVVNHVERAEAALAGVIEGGS
jgi:hypothetical protein